MTNDAVATMTRTDAGTRAEVGDIGRALQLLMRSLDVDKQQAFDFMFDASELGGCGLVDLARDIIAGESLEPTRADAEPG